MFKCWIYLSGDNAEAGDAQLKISDNKIVYPKSCNITNTEEKESDKISSYFPDMSSLRFFERFKYFT
ncbi:MAG: hypothetical protein JSS63_00280 [Bacteroidetes bacterium]|nr:hypothetical protein [Bacteroidota bacterium]MBX7045041.1 hypothetical protein [Ignavibacteria bacterium]